MLDVALKTQLQTLLQRLSRPIEIVQALDTSAKSQELAGLLAEISALSDQVHIVDETDRSVRCPSFALRSVGERARIRFAGIPMGHEFTSLILALLQTGGVAPKITEESAAQIHTLSSPLAFATYISLSCQNCPDIVQALNAMAVLNSNISHTMIDGALYQAEVTQRQILAVPTIYLNGQMFGQGRMSLEEILAKLDTSSSLRTAEKLNAKKVFDMLIIGGGPAGAAASIYAARKGIRTGVVAERFGGQTLDTLAIENFVSVKETEGPKFAQALEQHVRAYDVDIMNLQRAKRLIPGSVHQVELENGAILHAKTVLISTGARWREMNVPGEHEYRNKGVAYCPHCDGPLFKGKRVAVVGGGNSGVEAAIDLAGIVSHVTLLEFAPTLRADAVLQRKLESLRNVTIIANAQTTEVLGANGKVTGLTFRARETGLAHALVLEGIFVQIGLLPNTDWLKGTVALSQHGEIKVGVKGETSAPGVFAAGDVTTVPFKQIIIATGDGAKAALGAFDYLMRSSEGSQTVLKLAA